MATLAIAAVGAAFTHMIGLGPGLGWAAGSVLGRALLADEHKIEGPRLGDTSIADSTTGKPIDIVYGTCRTAGNYIWLGEIKEVEIDPEDGGKKKSSLGKGAKGQPGVAYFLVAAVGICEGPIDSVLQVWANGNLIYDRTGKTPIFWRYPTQPRPRFYLGTETQNPDPTIESYEGEGNVPGYRGLAYMVLDDFPLAEYGNVPSINWTFVVTRNPTPAFPITAFGEEGTINGTGFADIWSFDPLRGRFLLRGGDMITVDYLTLEIQQIETGSIFTAGDIDPGCGFYYEQVGSSIGRRDPLTFQLLETAPTVGNWFITDIGWTTAGRALAYMSQGHRVGVHNIPFLTISSNTIFVGEDHGMVLIPARTLFEATTFVGAGHIWAIGKNAFPNASESKLFEMIWLGPGEDLIVLREIDLAAQGVGNAYGLAFYVEALPAEGEEREYGLIIGGLGDGDVEGGLPGGLYFLNMVTGQIERSFTDAAPTNHLHSFSAYTGGDRFYFLGDDVFFYEIDIPTMTQVNSWDMTGFVVQVGQIGNYFYDPFRHAVWFTRGVGGSGSQIYIAYLDRQTGDGITLRSIVEDLCDRAGLDVPTQVDAAELTDLVHGFCLGRRDSIRNFMQMLAVAYFFDGVESDAQLEFKKRGRAIADAIPEIELGATHHQGSRTGEQPVLLHETAATEQEIPRRIEVRYVDQEIDYQQNVQHATRIFQPGNSDERMVFDLPIAFANGATEAKQVADILLQAAWFERRSYRFETMIKYLALDPTDPVLVTRGGATTRIRLVTAEYGANRLLRFEGVFEFQEQWTSLIEVGAVSPGHRSPNFPIFAPICVDAIAFDNAVVADNQLDDAGFFVAAAASSPSLFRSATLFRSSDGGQTFTPISMFTQDAVSGTVIGTLGDAPQPFNEDRANELTVRLRDTNDVLASTTEALIEAGANLAVVGDEVIQFRTVTDNGDGTFTLTNLRRGLQGSDDAIDGHTIAEPFVLLRTASAALAPGVKRIEGDVASLGDEIVLKIVPAGGTLEGTHATEFTPETDTLKPLAPVHLEGERDGSGNVTISWFRRSRFSSHDPIVFSPPLGEEAEAYEVDIYDGFEGSVVRTLSSTTSSVVYTAAQQTADFGAPQSVVHVAVYQISTTVGRGDPATCEGVGI